MGDDDPANSTPSQADDLEAATALIDAAAATLLRSFNQYQLVNVLAAQLGRHIAPGSGYRVMPTAQQSPPRRARKAAPIAGDQAQRSSSSTTPAPPPPPMIDENAAAELARVTPRTLRRWRVAGLIPFYTTRTGRVRYREADVLACPQLSANSHP